MSRAILCSCCVFALSQLAARAEEPAARDSLAMSARIDQLLAERWTAAKVQPAPLADDGEFLRRASLDLCGSIPTVAEVRAFLSDPHPDKRAHLIDAMLNHPDHPTHLADVWRNILLPGDLDDERLGGQLGFQNWLRTQFVRNFRYDRLVDDLLTARGSTRTPGAALFYTALQSKPEELAASTSRIFLGVQIQCAQCHDHPLDKWKQTDFWGYAAFFARVRQANLRGGGIQIEELPGGDVKLPDSDTIVPVKFLDSKDAAEGDDRDRRARLALWFADTGNPYFARATANRVWGLMFGRGLTEPVDDMGPLNPPSHPQLLDELAIWFIGSGYDLRELFRVLANTRAYQLSSQTTDGQKDPAPELFARMAIKNLTAEQLYDALSKATLRRGPRSVQGMGAVDRLNDPERAVFLSKFRSSNPKATEYQSGIPQALILMNGQTVSSATAIEQSPLLESLEAPFFTDEERLEALFLAALSREPRTEEHDLFLAHIKGDGANADRRKALSDILWAVLNSAEFALNH